MNSILEDLSLQLISGRVIIVKCPGRVTEVFVPTLVNNRIAIHNVIPERRCCKQSFTQSRSSLGMQSEGTTTRSFVQDNAPLANSTPTRPPFKESQNPGTGFPSPEIVRRAVVHNGNISVTSLVRRPGLKIVPLHRTPTASTPSKLARILPVSRTASSIAVSLRTSQSQVLRNISNVSSFVTPASPHLFTPRSPNQSFLVPSTRIPGSASKWRKCITPQRTYLRRSNVRKSSIVEKTPVNKEYMTYNNHLIPDFRRNPTVHPKFEKTELLIKRKLIVDKKRIISPKSFKKQLKDTSDLNRSSFQLPKSRKEFIISHQTAFDLLTNSSFYPGCTKRINDVFRKGCQNKKSETINKYKPLATSIPSLEPACTSI